MPHSELHKKKLKTNLAIIGGIFIFCLIVGIVTVIKIKKASAQENVTPIQCGEATSGSIDTASSQEYCNIYQRQLEFKESADKLRDEIEQRSENFAAPRRAAREQYEADLEALHKSIK